MKPRSELIERWFNGSSEEAFQLTISNYIKAAHELTNLSLNDDEFSFDRLIFHPRNQVDDFFFYLFFFYYLTVNLIKLVSF